MDSKSAQSNWFLASGYTLIEMLVVITVMAIVSSITLFGLKKYNSDQVLINAQMKLVSDLRSTQAKALSGANGSSVQTYPMTLYQSGGVVYGASSSNDGDVRGSSYYICFAHPALNQFGPTTNKCGNCTGNDFATCDYSNNYGSNKYSGLITISLTYGSSTKYVYIDSSGMKINRIYAQ